MFLFGEAINTSKKQDYRKLYGNQRSFTDLLPWVEYLPDSKQFLFDDGVTRMAVFEITPIPTEGRSQESLEGISNDLANVISETFPEKDIDPWVLQVYVNSESDLSGQLESVWESVEDDLKDTQYTKEFMRVYENHLKEVGRESGYFHDTAVTDAPWRGKMQRIRICIYRRYWKSSPRVDPAHELDQVCEKLVTGLQANSIRPKRVDGKNFFQWMLMWFNPSPEIYNGSHTEMIANVPYPGDDNPTLGFDLAEAVLLNQPQADKEKGIWYFDDMPHTVIQIGKLHRTPLHGALTGEITRGTRTYALTDKLPENSVLALTVFIIPQDTIKNRVKLISDRAIGDTAESRITKREASMVLEKQAKNDKLFPMEGAVFVRGRNEHDLHKNTVTTRALLTNIGLATIDPEKDPIGLDNFIKNLPGVQIEAVDRLARQRAKVAFSSNIASMLPFYGRSRGTGNAGVLYWNRSGEPLMADPLNGYDRKKNGHLLELGPTGAGKSADLIWKLQSQLAIHRPRVFIIDVGNSFGLFGEHAKENGLTVNHIALSMSSNVATPPFADVIKLADKKNQLEVVVERSVNEELSKHLKESKEKKHEDEEERDILGEAEMIAVLMITGGEAMEMNKLSRSNRMVIRRAIMLAAEAVYQRKEGECKTVMPSDIADEIINLSQTVEYKESSKEIREMGDAMKMFCSGLSGKLFNREGDLWPDCDITIIDMAQAARKGNEDILAVAYTSLIQHINALVERNQMSSRNTIVLTDEAHIITKNPLLMPYVVSITKMWRKLGAWYWLGTQNIADFPDSAETLLNMIEWWFCLTMPPDEIKQISRFKKLSNEQKEMMESCTKEPQKYTEGVLLSDSLQTLFRNVPPPLSLALAQTEKHEKSARQALMNEHGITEVQAVYRIAESMIEKGRERSRAASLSI